MTESANFVNNLPQNGVISGSNAENSSLSAPADDEILDDIEALVKQAEVQPLPQPVQQQQTLQQQAERALLSEGAHDEGNAVCAALRHPGQFLNNDSFGWMYFTGTHWTRSGADAALGVAVTETLKARLMAAASAGQPDQYKHILLHCMPNSGRVKGAINQLGYKTYASPGEFDADPDLLNCLNGVIDLRTGALYPHSPNQHFTVCAPVEYEPATDYSQWVSWLKSVVKTELTAQWLQMAVGYTLTGRTNEEILFYLYGPPRSGKGTFIETLLTIMGQPLAEAISFGMLTADRDVDTQNFQLAPLRSARLIAASESNAYERFNEAKVKQITGGDSIQCAFKHKTPFTYRPQFKIWLSSNQPVNADPEDDAVWGRLRVIEFPNSHLGKEDKALKERMRSPEMLRSVLAWAVEGARMWYALGSKGLPELQSSAAIKSAQRADLDHVQAWISECCEKAESNEFTSHQVLYKSYTTWCANSGVEAKRQKGFSQSMKKKGYQDKFARIDGSPARGFMGIKVR